MMQGVDSVYSVCEGTGSQGWDCIWDGFIPSLLSKIHTYIHPSINK